MTNDAQLMTRSEMTNDAKQVTHLFQNFCNVIESLIVL